MAKQPPSGLPSSVDFRLFLPPDIVLTQVLNDCIGSASGNMYRVQLALAGQPDTGILSRRWFYGMTMERSLHNSVGGMKRNGVVPEEVWPYYSPDATINLGMVPPPDVQAIGQQHRVLNYTNVQRTEAAIKGCLAGGHAIGFETFSSFFHTVGADGMMTVDGVDATGEHAAVIVGYSPNLLIVLNSWGPDYGQRGFCYAPMTLLTGQNVGCYALTSVMG